MYIAHLLFHAVIDGKLIIHRYFYEDGVCFVFAKPGTLSRGDLECSMVTDGTEVERWVLQPTEIQISPLLEITRDAGQAQVLVCSCIILLFYSEVRGYHVNNKS